LNIVKKMTLLNFQASLHYIADEISQMEILTSLKEIAIDLWYYFHPSNQFDLIK
jgi:hypothetical protein